MQDQDNTDETSSTMQAKPSSGSGDHMYLLILGLVMIVALAVIYFYVVRPMLTQQPQPTNYATTVSPITTVIQAASATKPQPVSNTVFNSSTNNSAAPPSTPH